MDYPPGTLLAEGKTKRVYASDSPHTVRIVSKDTITAFDDPSKTVELPGKGALATATTCNIFECLREAGVPVAYVKRWGDNDFIAPACRMVPIEAIGRRVIGPKSSYRQRHPELGPGNVYLPRLVTEYNLKTSGGRLMVGDHTVVEGLDPLKGEEDPLITGFEEPTWWCLKHPKTGADLERCVLKGDVIGDYPFVEFERFHRRTVLTIEALWEALGYQLEDIKLEYGINAKGELLLADVVDADSWRLCGPNGCEYSKQVFRDMAKNSTPGEADLGVLGQLYAEIADLTLRMRIPKQAIILWLGSRSDKKDVEEGLKKALPMPAGVDLKTLILSGHRDTRAVLDTLPMLDAAYPDGYVVIACVGLSNGLGPVVSAHTGRPVINVPLTPEDAPSSLRLPGNVPASTVLRLPNAVHQALQILGFNNPAARALVRGLAEADAGLKDGADITGLFV